MKGKYQKRDLEHGGDTPEEHDRLRGIFDDLVERGRNGYELSIIEQEFVFQGITYFNENPNNYPFVEEARFGFTYLTYFTDFSGGNVYVKARFGRVVEVPLLEKENDLLYLQSEADAWRKYLEGKKSFSDELKQQAISEARIDLKELRAYHNIADNPFLGSSYFYEYKELGSILRSKANYIFGKKYLENTALRDLSFSFCGETIEFTPYSMIHILNRHFAEITKQYPSGKDYHIEDFAPWFLPKQLKEIMTAIDQKGVFSKKEKTEVNIIYNGEIYQFWAEPHIRYVKGSKEPIPYKRIKSFYRVRNSNLITKLKNDFEVIQISGSISVFLPILKEEKKITNTSS